MQNKFVACSPIEVQTDNNSMETKDSNGNILNDGDSVHVVKDLKVKGMSTTLKRGNVIKGIRLTGSPNEVECRVGKSTVVLKTEFLKKV
jgi:protein PhnA